MAKKKCFVCRQMRSYMNRKDFLFSNTETREEFCLCSYCFGYFYGKLNFGYNAVYDTNIIIHQAATMGLFPSAVLMEIYNDEAATRIGQIFGLNVHCAYFVYGVNQYILINEEGQQLAINGVKYAFSDIKDYVVRDDSLVQSITAPETTTYNTHTKNGLRRTIAGSLLAGNIGGAMGAITSDHSLSIEKSGSVSYEKEDHDFSILVNFKKISQISQIIKIGPDTNTVYRISNLFDKILDK